MRKALIVGINNYMHISPLQGCVNDAKRVANLLRRNEDGSINFDVKEITCDIGDRPILSNRQLRYELSELFNTNCDVALFYFAGHGYADNNGGYILTSPCQDGNEGIPVSDITNLIQYSRASNNIVILDCCHAGAMGNSPLFGDNAIIPSGTTYLLACKENQYSQENNGNGVFTALLINALNGGAANLVGEISPGSIYAYIDQALSLWQQRPVFKTNVERFIYLRKVRPSISLEDLRKLNEIFPKTDYEFPLDPSYEPTSNNADEKNTKIFAILQKYNRLNLLVPVNAGHMYYAAINSQSCKLTPLGVHYWNLVNNNRI